MVHARVSKSYIHFALMYTADHIFPVLPIKDLIKEYGKPTTPFKLVTDTEPSVSLSACYFSMCCTEIYCTCWDKGVKCVSPSAEGFSRFLRCNSTASKRVSCLRTTHTEDNIFIICCFYGIFSSELVCTSQPYAELNICDCLCNTHLILHPQGYKLAI